MSDRNPYSQYNYDSYDRDPSVRMASAETFRERMAARFSNPLFATVAVLVTGAVFAGIIIASYPDPGVVDQDVPIIQADAGDLREAPEDRGGFSPEHEDSTVFSNIRSAALEEKPPVENLLESEKPMDKLEAFAKEAEATYDGDGETAAPEITEEITEVKAEGDAEEPALPAETKTAEAAKPTVVEEVEAPPEVAEAEPEPAAALPAGSSQIKHPAGASPDTLAFVRSVLNEKDSKAASQAPGAARSAVNTQAAITQPEMSRIEPAAGAASATAGAVASGSYYVQLGSVSSEAAASSEWGRLRKSFGSLLESAQYRVQRADLGAKGIYYRIQAGPVSKELAASMCDAIKAKKPGGCIVVQ